MPKVFITGHQGMVGSAVVRAIEGHSEFSLLVADRKQLNLLNQSQVEEFLASERPDIIINAAARVGGIYANSTYPAEFIHQNLVLNSNLIHSAWKNGVSRFLNLGSSCIYPRRSEQPIKEEYLLTGSLEKTNEAYALAKIAALEMCRHYRHQYDVLFHSAMPTNLYGPGDNYNLENSHVLPALIRKFHEAKETKSSEVAIWGSGTPRRELMHVDDLAAGVLFLLNQDNPPDWVNLGTGIDHSIQEIAILVKKIVGYEGEMINDTTKPDGMPLKRLDVSLADKLGWKARISLEDGIRSTYIDFCRSLVDKSARL